MSITSNREAKGQKCSPEFQQLKAYMIGVYGLQDGLKYYNEWLKEMEFDEKLPLMFQYNILYRKDKSLTKNADVNLITLYKKWKSTKELNEQKANQILDNLIKTAKSEQERLELTVVRFGNMTPEEAVIMGANPEDIAKIVRGKPTNEARNPHAVSIIEESMKVDLKRDPMALQKLGRKWEEAREK